MTQQIAKRAFELYEKGSRQDGRAVQDWKQAKQDIRKDKPHIGKKCPLNRLAN